MTQTAKIIWIWRILVAVVTIGIISQIGYNQESFWFGIAAVAINFGGEAFLKSIGRRNDGTYF